MKLLPKSIITILFTALCFCGSGFAQEVRLGDVRDGNRSPHVHKINLLDEEGETIRMSDFPRQPFSSKQTCGECHSYAKIAGGWHFNAADETVPPGRPGEPWILADPLTATQVPLSFRKMKGTFQPGPFGMTPFTFTGYFGRHLPGGGISENDSSESVDTYMRWQVSGKADINCLACHDAEAAHDQAEYELQMRKQNFRWAAAAATGFAEVEGSAKEMPDNYDIYSGVVYDKKDAVPPTVMYDAARFDKKDRVFVDVTGEPPDMRCGFCHSAKRNDDENWTSAGDVHLAAGLHCIDCHKNGLDHDMIRGYEGEYPNRNHPAAAYSCSGCHLRENGTDEPAGGTYGAPRPEHKGLPAVHFEKLTCTACHSGQWPGEKAGTVKLSRTHALGTHSVKRSNDAVPVIYEPVYVKNAAGKIEPRRIMWPAFWGFKEGDTVKPALLETVRSIALAVILQDSLTDSVNVEKVLAGEWPAYSDQQIINILDSLKTVPDCTGTPVYISGGKAFTINDLRIDVREDIPAAQPYSWAFAHDVRPAGQSAGVRGCSDCHSLSSPFMFGTVSAGLPFDFSGNTKVKMALLERTGTVYPGVFSFTFLFRPFVKYLILFCCCVISLVVILFMFKGLESILQKLSGKQGS